MRHLAAFVHVADEKGEVHIFGPADLVPAWAEAKITNPEAWADVDEAVEEVPAAAEAPAAPSEGPPPKAGPGSGTEEWVAYAVSLGITVPENPTRADVITLVEEHEQK